MMAFSEGLDPQVKPPQPLLPGFHVGGGEEDIIESDLTLREEFQSRGAVPASSCWLSAHIDANRPVDDRAHVHLGIPHVGAELLGEEVAQLLHREAFHVEGTQAGEIQGAVGANREASAQFGQIEQFDLEAIAWAEDVGVVGDLGALLQRQGLFLPLFHQSFHGLHLEQALGGRQRGLQAQCQSGQGGDLWEPSFEEGQAGFHAERYGKAEAVQAVERTDANLAPMRLNAVALFGWRSAASWLPTCLCNRSGCALKGYDFVAHARRWRALSLSLSLGLVWRGICFSHAHGDGCDPWQTPVISAVEAVEPCSRPVLSQQTWCVHVWEVTSS